MKTALIVLIIFMAAFMPASVKAQNKSADRIIGYYLTYDDETGAEKSQVQICKATTGKYSGKIVWLKEPNKDGKPKVDDKNPDPKLRSRPSLGLQILNNFTFDAKNSEWSDGTIYDPLKGKTYNCYIKFESETKLKIRGYIGAAWMGLGRTVVWTKEQSLRK
jgi:uncharacterized protein (DUF2147 family)